MSFKKKFEKEKLSDIYDCPDLFNDESYAEIVEEDKKEVHNVKAKFQKQGQKFKRMFSSFSNKDSNMCAKDSEPDMTRISSFSEIANQSAPPLDDLETGPSIHLIKLKYVGKSSTFLNSSFSQPFKNFHIGDLVKIRDGRDLFGRIKFFLSDKQDGFIGIGLKEEAHDSLDPIIEQILFTGNFSGKPFNGVIVHSVYIENFNHPLKMECPPFLCEESFKFVEKAAEMDLLNGKFIKFSMSNIYKYGQVKQMLKINGVPCLEISPIKYGSVNDETRFLKSSDALAIKHLRLELIYYDGVVILHDSIVKMEPYTTESWSIGNNAHFILRSSGERFYGKVNGVLSVNDVPSAIVQVDKTENEKLISGYLACREILDKFDYHVNQRSYIIPLSLLRMDSNRDLFTIITFMLENDGEGFEKVLNEVLKIKDESILPFLINHARGEIDLEKTPELLNKLFERKDFESLKVLLTKSRSGEGSDLIFLELGCKCLESQNKELFATMIDKCSNKNLRLKNNETFLTNLFKTHVPENVILDIILDNKFDIAQSNGDGETPLTLACHNLWLTTIEIILRSPKIDQHEISKANKIIFDFDTNITLEEEAKKFRAARLLKRDLSDNVCSICMDRVMDVSLSCGHRFCQQCSNKIVKCAICKKVIEGRTKLYN